MTGLRTVAEKKKPQKNKQIQTPLNPALPIRVRKGKHLGILEAPEYFNCEQKNHNVLPVKLHYHTHRIVTPPRLSTKTSYW